MRFIKCMTCVCLRIEYLVIISLVSVNCEIISISCQTNLWTNQIVTCDLCPLKIIDLKVSNFECLFWFFPLGLPAENNNKYLTFKIRLLQIDELPRTLFPKFAVCQPDGCRTMGQSGEFCKETSPNCQCYLFGIKWL